MSVSWRGLVFGDNGTGYVVPSLAAIRGAVADYLRDLKNLPGLNTLPGSFFGDMIDIAAGVLDANAQATVDGVSKAIFSQAFDTSLDQLLDPATIRLAATASTAVVYAYGTSLSTVPVSSIVRTSPTAAAFAFDAGITIPALAAAEAWVFEMDAFAAGEAAGVTFTLTVDGNAFAATAGPGDSSLDILDNLISQLNGAALTQVGYLAGTRPDGSRIAGLVREEQGGGPFPTTLVNTGTSITYFFPADSATVTASATGPTQAAAQSLRFGQGITGIEGYTNVTAAVVGRDRETDSQLRARHQLTQRRGSGSPDAIRSIMLTPIEQGGAGATYASVEYNTENFTNAVGNLPHSLRLILDADTDKALAARILFAYKAAGDNTNGGFTELVPDSEGTTQEVRLDELEVLYIWCDVEVTIGTGWPANGDPLSQLRTDLVNFINGLGGNKSVKPNEAPVSLRADGTSRGVANFRLRFGSSTDPLGILPPITYLDYWPDPQDDASQATVEITGRQVAETVLANVTATIV